MRLFPFPAAVSPRGVWEAALGADSRTPASPGCGIHPAHTPVAPAAATTRRAALSTAGAGPAQSPSAGDGHDPPTTTALAGSCSAKAEPRNNSLTGFPIRYVYIHGGDVRQTWTGPGPCPSAQRAHCFVSILLLFFVSSYA